MNVIEYIIEEGLIMIPTLWFIGYIIGNTKKIANCYIPFILLVVSLILTPILLGSFDANNIVQAILVTGGAVLTHEAITNGIELAKGD